LFNLAFNVGRVVFIYVKQMPLKDKLCTIYLWSSRNGSIHFVNMVESRHEGGRHIDLSLYLTISKTHPQCWPLNKL